MDIIHPIVEAWRNGWAPPFRGEIYEYAASIKLRNGYAIKGRFDVSRSKYLIQPFKALRNYKVRQVVILKAVQTGGSLLADLWVPYIIEHAPGDLLWLLQDDRFAVTYMAERFMPLLKGATTMRPWLESAGKYGVQRNALLFPHMSVMIGGLNEGNVQSLSKRYVIIDECWMAGSNGLIRQAKERTTAYPHTRKILLISQAGIEGDDLDLEWKSSLMREWQWQCPSCQKHQTFEMSAKRNDGSWAGMRWDTNETTRPNGRWNYPAVGRTARLECFHCGHQLEDTPTNRRKLDETHRFHITNEGADTSIDGYHWPAIANCDISFASIVTKYLKAKEQQEDHGYTLPLQEFYQKQLAVPWNVNTSADYRRISYEPYDVVSDWPEEAFRFLTVDCQKDFKEFWAVVRAWARSGESRQLARKRLESWSEVADFQTEWKIPDQRVFVDCGYEQTEVARECVKHGHAGIVGRTKRWLCWVALKGARQETFIHIQPNGVKDRRIYSEMGFLDPNIGTGKPGQRCPFFAWSNLNVKDILRRHRDGLAAKFLSLPDTAPADDIWSYTAQMNSEMRVKERDENGKMISVWKPISRRPNHFWDCEAEQVVAALICGVIGGKPTDEDDEHTERQGTLAATV